MQLFFSIVTGARTEIYNQTTKRKSEENEGCLNPFNDTLKLSLAAIVKDLLCNLKSIQHSNAEREGDKIISPFIYAVSDTGGIFRDQL